MTVADSTSGDPASPPTSPTSSSLLPHIPLASDISHPSVSIQSVKETSWGDVPLLDKTLNNYTAWRLHVVEVLQLSSGLDLYLDGLFPAPNPQLEPRANRYWKINNTAVRAFLRMKCAPSERPFIEKCTTAQDVWSTLEKRHVHQGPMSQITLIQEAFSTYYSSSTLFASTTLVLRDLNRRIWDMGTPTPEGFLCILMLLALSADPSLSAVRDAIITGLSTSTADRPFTSEDIVARLDYEQQARSMATARTVATPAEAHVAKTSSSDSKQSVCSNCKRLCHTVEFCIQPDGGMAGKTISEAQQARDVKRGKTKTKEKSPKGSAGSIIQSGNQAYIVDADGKALKSSDCLLSSHPLPLSTLPTSCKPMTLLLLTLLSSTLCVPLMLKNTRI